MINNISKFILLPLPFYLLVLCSGCAESETKIDSSTNNTTTLQEPTWTPEEMKFDLETFARGYSQAWSGRRPEFVAMHFAEEGILRVNDGAPAEGRDQITEIAQGFMTDLPDMVVSFDSLITKSNGTEFHWTLTGTNSGPGGTGKKIKVSGFELWTMSDDGLIKNSQGHFPSAEYNRQLEFGINNQ